MRLLLDTYIALWLVDEPHRVSAATNDLVLEAGGSVWVSAVSIWEIAIKHQVIRKGRRMMPMSGRDARAAFLRAGFQELPVTMDHAIAVDDLPPHHGDPFDLLLIAQALAEPLRLLTADRQLAAYGSIVITA
jgi:PIN domain nuclease of toxin-antitoxin system